MAKLRFEALQALLNRKYDLPTEKSSKISDYYGENVFHDRAMQQYLSKDIYKRLRRLHEQWQNLGA